MTPSDAIETGETEVRVLLVDDDSGWVRSTAERLEHERKRFVVETATDLSEARIALHDDPDCVVCDYQLAGESGLELLADVREVDSTRPFILVTGRGSEAVASSAIAQRVTDYIRKQSLGGRDDHLARRIDSAVRAYRTERALATERRANEAMVDIVTNTTSREQATRSFCEHLVAEHPFGCAWIGSYDAGVGVVPLAAAGSVGYVDAVIGPGLEPAGSSEPAAVAVTRREPHGVRSSDQPGDDTDGEGSWRRTARSYGFDSAAAAPILHEGSLIGVLAVYSEGTAAFDARESSVLDEYGSAIGHALMTAEWKQSLLSAAPIVVEFGIDSGSTPLGSLARRLPGDASIGVLTAVDQGDRLRYLCTVTDASSDAVRDAARAVDAIQEVEFFAGEEADRCDLLVRMPTPESELVEYGARVLETAVDRDRTTVTVALPDREGIQSIADALRAAYPGASVGAVRSTPAAKRQRSLAAAIDTLTEKQRQAIKVAFHGGYFERPREHNTTELAERLGVSRATFTQHLRAAERKVFSRLLDPLPAAESLHEFSHRDESSGARR